MGLLLWNKVFKNSEDELHGRPLVVALIVDSLVIINDTTTLVNRTVKKKLYN